jgi:hypothetical protein
MRSSSRRLRRPSSGRSPRAATTRGSPASSCSHRRTRGGQESSTRPPLLPMLTAMGVARFTSGSKLAALLILLGAGGALAACGGGREASGGGVTFEAVITRVSGTRTVVQTVTSRVSTTGTPAPVQPSMTMADVVESGYRACLSVPKSLVRPARYNPEARLRLARKVVAMLASIGPPGEQSGLLVGCLRALKLPSLRPGTNA